MRYDPIPDQSHETLGDVFFALLDEFDLPNRQVWAQRWEDARAAKARLDAYNREYDQSLMGVTRFGQ